MIEICADSTVSNVTGKLGEGTSVDREGDRNEHSDRDIAKFNDKDYAKSAGTSSTAGKTSRKGVPKLNQNPRPIRPV